MATSTENKLKIVEQVSLFHSEDESLKEFFDFYDLSVSLSIAEGAGLITGLTERGIKQITDAFDGLLEILGVEDTGFELFSDFWGNDED